MIAATPASQTPGLQIDTREDGYREFWTDEEDTSKVHIFLEDYTGRRRSTTVHKSAVLLMVPMGPIGALVFEPTGVVDQDMTTPVWAQRIIVGALEVQAVVRSTIGEMMRAAQIDRDRILKPDAKTARAFGLVPKP